MGPVYRPASSAGRPTTAMTRSLPSTSTACRRRSASGWPGPSSRPAPRSACGCAVPSWPGPPAATTTAAETHTHRVPLPQRRRIDDEEVPDGFEDGPQLLAVAGIQWVAVGAAQVVGVDHTPPAQHGLVHPG